MAKRQIADSRISWTDPQMIPLEERRTAGRLSDLFVRQTLASARTRSGDQNEVRLGTAPIANSPIAADRLDQEIRRLTTRLGVQSKHFQDQAARLRPKNA